MMDAEELLRDGAEETAPAGETAAQAMSDPAPDPVPETAPETAPEVDYAALAASDLATLRTEVPEAKGLPDLSALPDPRRYGELRDLGLSPVEAYLATCPPARRSDNRSHLRTAVPRSLAEEDAGLSATELDAARELFPNLSDAGIRRLYKKVNR